MGPGATGARRTRIDAVEIHAPHIGALHRAAYDEAWFPVDAVDLLKAAPENISPRPPETWDLVLSMDMIEHLDGARGQRFIAAAVRRCRTLLVSTLMDPSPQGSVFGNERERHVSRWRPVDFEPFGAVQGFGVGGGWVVMVTPK